MNLKVIGTGSKGNCYILDGEKEFLIIETGMPLKDVKKAVNFDMYRCGGALTGHRHSDHFKYHKEYLSAGIEVFASAGTWSGTKHHNAKVIKSGVKYSIGEFTIVPFDINHDAPEPLGFLIHHKECGLTLFLTDSFYSKYAFKGLNNIIVEANFCEDIIEQKASYDNQFLNDRILKSHLSIQKCIDLLNSNDLSHVNNIVLIHLSDRNSNALEFKKKVEKATGIHTTIAENNLIIDFNKVNF